MIRLLPPEVRSSLRSGVATPSLAQCVEELVLNSVDSEATCIAVRVDIPNCKIQVVDNGRGLTKEDFELVGQRYATSKCYQLNDLDHLQQFGYRGEALASISQISQVVEIVSRVKGCDLTLSKVFRDGKSEVFEAAQRPSIGTTVTVHNVFHNMPVRRKLVSVHLDYERVCQRIEGLALIHPNVSFSLRDDSTGAKSIQTHITPSLINTFRFLFGQAKAKSLKEVSHQHGKFSISGYMGAEGHPSKNLQFIYVNSRLVLKTKLHKAVNFLLRKSLIAHYRPRERDTTTVEMSEIDLINSPGKEADYYGIFVLNVKCPLSEYDICLEPAKSLVEFRDWGGVMQCIEQLVNTFLTHENLIIKVEKETRQSSHGNKSGILILDYGSSQEEDEGMLDERLPDDQETTSKSYSTSLSQKYGRGISAAFHSSTLQSRTVRRPQLKLASDPNGKCMSPEVSLKLVSGEEFETWKSELTVNATRSDVLEQIHAVGYLAEGKDAVRGSEVAPCDSELSDVAKHCEREELSKSEESTHADAQQSCPDTKGNNGRCNLEDEVTTANILPCIVTASGCLHTSQQHRKGSFPLEQFISQSSETNSSLEEPALGSQQQLPSSFSPRIDVFLELTHNEQAAEMVMDSEGTEDAVSVIMSLSESEENPQNSTDHKVFPRLVGRDKTTSVCQPVPESANEAHSYCVDYETSCSSGSMRFTSDKVCNRAASEVQWELFSKLRKNTTHSSVQEPDSRHIAPLDTISLVHVAQHKKDANSSASFQENTSTFPSNNLKIEKSIETDNQRITPETRNLRENLGSWNGRIMRKQETSSISSDSGSTSSRFKSEVRSKTSDSCLQFEQDELHEPSKSTYTVSSTVVGGESVRTPSETCNVNSNVKPKFIALEPLILNNSQREVSNATSTSTSFNNTSTSSLETFRKSIQTSPCSDGSVRNSISELPRGQDEKVTSRFFHQKYGTQHQGAHFTTTSPVVLKRSFTPGLMILGNYLAKNRPKTKSEISGEASLYGVNCTDTADCEASVQLTSKEDPNLFKVGTEQTTQPFVVAEKSKHEDFKMAGCTKSDQVVKCNEACNSKTQEHRIDRESTQVAVHIVGNDEEHTGSTPSLSLKRLRQMPVSQTSNSSNPKIYEAKSTVQENLSCENRIEKKESMLMKKFMTSDSFLQTVHEVLQPVVTVTANSPPTEETSANVNMLQGDCMSLKHINVKKNVDIVVSDESNSKDLTPRENNNLPSKCKGINESINDSKTQSQGKELVVKMESVSEESWHAQRVKDAGCWSSGLGRIKTILHGPEVMSSYSWTQPEELALDSTFFSNACQKDSESLPYSSSDNLPIFVDLCDANSVKPRERELSNPVNSDSQCVIFQCEPAVSPADDQSEVRAIECVKDVDRDWSFTTTSTANTSPAPFILDNSSIATTSLPEERVPEAHIREADFPLDDLEDVQDQSQHEKKRDNKVSAEELEVWCLNDSSGTLSPNKVHLDSKSGLPIVDNYQSEQEIQVCKKTSTDIDHCDNLHQIRSEPIKRENTNFCPKVFTDVSGKKWSCHYDTRLGRQMYVNLNTGYCTFNMPGMEKVGPEEDGMEEQEMTNSRDDTCALIIPTGRKMSHLHRFHSSCAEPFLTVSGISCPGRGTVSCINLSPSSRSALIGMVDDHVQQQDGEIASKWRGKHPIQETDAVDKLLDDWINPMFPSLESDVMDAQSSQVPWNSIRAQHTAHPYKFTKAMFQDIRVLGQVDEKFIACMVSTDEQNKAAGANLLLLIDQHAAHERVRLEQLTLDVFEDPAVDRDGEDCMGELSVIRSSSVIPSVLLSFPKKDLRLLQSFSKKLEKQGISYRIISGDDEMEEGRIEIIRLPACLVERETAELKRGRQPVAVSMVEALLNEHLEVLQRTSGASVILPKTITRVLNSQACHGAIKFGDQLNYCECMSLIGQLSHCDLPFQCAHGRPSLVPLLDLKQLASKLHDEVDEYKPRLWRVRNLPK